MGLYFKLNTPSIKNKLGTSGSLVLAFKKNGKIFHQDVNQTKPYQYELMFGWICHYSIGIIYGIVFTAYSGMQWLLHPTFLPAWIWGMMTIAFGWFLLHPGLGIGIAASKQHNAWKMRVLTIIAHSFFALGMYLTALLIKYLMI